MQPFDFDETLVAAQKRLKALEAADMYREYASNWLAEGGTMPHCDERVLHSKGTCTYCDKAQTLQQYRTMLGLKFTDELQENDPLLPGEDRTKASAEAWGGNR